MTRRDNFIDIVLCLSCLLLGTTCLVNASHPGILFTEARCNSGSQIQISGINYLRVILQSKNCTLNCSINIYDSAGGSCVELEWLDFFLAGLTTPGCTFGYVELSSKGRVIAARLCQPSPIYKLPLEELTIRVVLNGAVPGVITNSSGCYLVLEYRRCPSTPVTPPRPATSPGDTGKIIGIAFGALLGCIALPVIGFLIWSLVPKLPVTAIPVVGFLRPLFRPPPPVQRPIPRPRLRLRRSRPRRRISRSPSTISEESLPDPNPDPPPRFGLAFRMRPVMPMYGLAYRARVAPTATPMTSSDTPYYSAPPRPVDIDDVSVREATMWFPQENDGGSNGDITAMDDLDSASESEASLAL